MFENDFMDDLSSEKMVTISELIKQLNTSNSQKQEEIVIALAYRAAHETNHQMIREAQGVTALVNLGLLDSISMRTKRYIAGTLMNLAYIVANNEALQLQAVIALLRQLGRSTDNLTADYAKQALKLMNISLEEPVIAKEEVIAIVAPALEAMAIEPHISKKDKTKTLLLREDKKPEKSVKQLQKENEQRIKEEAEACNALGDQYWKNKNQRAEAIEEYKKAADLNKKEYGKKFQQKLHTYTMQSQQDKMLQEREKARLKPLEAPTAIILQSLPSLSSSVSEVVAITNTANTVEHTSQEDKFRKNIQRWINELVEFINNKKNYKQLNLLKPAIINITINDLEKLNDHAALCFSQNNYANLLKYMDTILTHSDTASSDWQSLRYQLACIYYSLKIPFEQDAKRIYKFILEHDDQEFVEKDKIYVALAEIALRHEKIQETKQYSKKIATSTDQEVIVRLNSLLNKIAVKDAKVHELNGDEYYRNNQWGEALNEYQQAAQLDYQSCNEKYQKKKNHIQMHQSFLEKANQALDNKQYAEAANLYKQILNTNQHHWMAKLGQIRSVCFQETSAVTDINKAISQCDLLIKQLSNNANTGSINYDILFARSLLNITLSKKYCVSDTIDNSFYLKVIADLEWAMSFSQTPSQAFNVYYRLGEIYKWLGNKYQFVLKNIGGLTEKAVEKSNHLMNLSYVKARDHFSAASRINPDSSEAHWELAEMLTLRQEYPLAKQHYQSAFLRNPIKYQRARISVAEIDKTMGNKTALIQGYQSILDDSSFDSLGASKTKLYYYMGVEAEENNDVSAALQFFNLANEHIAQCYDLTNYPLILVSKKDNEPFEKIILDKTFENTPILIKTAQAFYFYDAEKEAATNLGDIHDLLCEEGITFLSEGNVSKVNSYHPFLYEHIVSKHGNVPLWMSQTSDAIKNAIDRLTIIRQPKTRPACAFQFASNNDNINNNDDVERDQNVISAQIKSNVPK